MSCSVFKLNVIKEKIQNIVKYVFFFNFSKDLPQSKARESVLIPARYGQRPAWPTWMERTGGKDILVKRSIRKIRHTDSSVETKIFFAVWFQ